MMQVIFTNRQTVLKPDRPMLRRLCRAAAPPAWEGRALSVVFVDDARIAEMNRQYLGKDRSTDVLAFPLDCPDGSDRPLVGEVVVCAERAVQEAESRGLRPEEELALYVVHGALHLAGYDDHDAGKRRAMRKREAEILAGEGLRRDATGQ